MKFCGSKLFAGQNLSGVLDENFRRHAEEAADGSPHNVSKLQIRRAIIYNCEYNTRPVLGERFDASSKLPDRNGDVVMKAEIPFTGDRQLFFSAAPAWPPIRRLVGKVESNHLHLELRFTERDARWALALLTSEIGEINRALAAQREVVTRYNASLTDRAREFLQTYERPPVAPRAEARDPTVSSFDLVVPPLDFDLPADLGLGSGSV